MSRDLSLAVVVIWCLVLVLAMVLGSGAVRVVLGMWWPPRRWVSRVLLGSATLLLFGMPLGVLSGAVGAVRDAFVGLLP